MMFLSNETSALIKLILFSVMGNGFWLFLIDYGTMNHGV